MKSKPRFLGKRPEITPFFTRSAIIGFLLFVVALGIAAHNLGGLFTVEGFVNGLIYVTSIAPVGDLAEKLPDEKKQWILGLRGLAPIVTAAGLVLPWLLSLYKQYTCRYSRRNHRIICGLGWQGQAYAYNNRNSTAGTVVIELNVDTAARELCSKHSAYLIEGAADKETTLEEAGIKNAEQVFICTGSQDLNLDIAHRIKQIVANRSGNPLQVHISMGASLADATSTDEVFADLLGSDAKCQFSFYDPEARMARMFYYQYPVYRWAEEQFRPASDPVSVHLVFLGFNRLAGELILQYSRIWPCKGQHRPRFTIVVPDAARAKRFEARHSAVYQDGSDHLCAVADIHIEQVENNQVQLLNATLLDTLSKPMVTAVISCDDDPEVNLQRASHCRQLCKKLDCWRVPVLVHIDKREGADDLLELSRTQIDPADRILPFGSASDYCDLALLEYMDGWAQAIHSGYQSAAEMLDPELPANKPWKELPHYYHANNYRAADHVPVKLFSAGFQCSSTCPWPVYDPCKTQIEDLFKAEIESPDSFIDGSASKMIPVDDKSFAPFDFGKIYAISRLEHTSWINEHRIKGFTLGAHDKAVCRTHPNIVEWDTLPPKDQSKDLSHTITIAHRLATESNSINAALPIRIVLTDQSGLTWSEAKLYRQAMMKLFGDESFLKTIENHWLELISPLASGMDCLLTQVFLDSVYRSRDCGCLNHLVRGVSLIQPGTVPMSLIDRIHEEEFTMQKVEGKQCDIWWPLKCDKSTRTHEHYRYEMAKQRQCILKSASTHRRIHLYADGESPLPWIDKQRKELVAIAKIGGADEQSVNNILQPAEVIADAEQRTERWMGQEGDLLITASPVPVSNTHWWNSNKPAYSFDQETQRFRLISFEGNQPKAGLRTNL